MNIKLDWILSNEIAIGSAPKTLEDINHLKINGINGILSLCSKEENPFNDNLKEMEDSWEDNNFKSLFKENVDPTLLTYLVLDDEIKSAITH